MAALSEARAIKKRAGKHFLRAVAGTKKIFEGALVCLNSTGYATPGALAATLVADGVARETVDNTAGADGAVTVEIEKGVFPFANSTSTDAITRAEIGDNAYIVDDQTVAKTDAGATRSVAGKIVDVDADGVWIEIR